MSPLVADIVGLVGSALVVAGYAYANLARPVDLFVFNGLNLVGAALLAISLTVHFNLASMVLEVIWAAIAVAGLARAWRARA